MVGLSKKELINKTSYWSAQGSSFRPIKSDILFDVLTANFKMKNIDSLGKFFTVGVNLPHNAAVTAVVAFGSDLVNAWTMWRITNIGGALSLMATETTNVEEESISNAIIDNNTYSYVIRVAVGVNEEIESARVTYTTDYD